MPTVDDTANLTSGLREVLPGASIVFRDIPRLFSDYAIYGVEVKCDGRVHHREIAVLRTAAPESLRKLGAEVGTNILATAPPPIPRKR